MRHFHGTNKRTIAGGLCRIILILAVALVLGGAPLVLGPGTAGASPGDLDIFKFLDHNRNGVYQPAQGEVPIQGWEFTITGPETHSGTTGSDGHLVFTGLTAGDYTVTETVKEGWPYTTTNPLTGVTVNGTPAQVQFGNDIEAGIGISRKPAPPNYVVNDGTMTECFGWDIRYHTTADYYEFYITGPNPSPALVHGPIQFPPQPASSIDAYPMEHCPIVRDVTTAPYCWAVPLGLTAGMYTAHIDFYSDETGLENTGTTIFQVRDKAHLTVDITSPTGGETYSTLQHFTVNATVNNTGDSQADGVTATISVTGPANVTPPLTKPTSPANIPPASSGTVSWDLECSGSGSVLIEVTAAGTGHVSGSAIPPENIDPDSVTVNQELKAHLTAVITAPGDGSTYNTCTDFQVTATVTNPGEADALDVYAQLIISANASVVGGANPQPLGTISSAGGSAIATWTVHCDSLGDSVLTVDPTGIDENTGVAIIEANTDEDSITVHQAGANLEIFKFNDIDADGINDTEDFGLDGWHFSVTGPENFPDVVTSGGGWIRLYDITPGTYTVTEVLKPDWTNTKPGGAEPYEQTVLVESGKTAYVEFGNKGPEVPTLTQWGIIGMAALFLAGLVVLGVRQRQRVSSTTH